MEKTLDALTKQELMVLARIRLAVTVHVAAIAGEADPELVKRARKKPFILSLSAPHLPPAFIRSDGKSLTAFAGGARPPIGIPSITLRFASAFSCASALSGGGGSPLPLPRGPGALAGLGFFRKASSLAPKLLADSATPAPLKARLLAAALRGLPEVAVADPWLAERLAHVPDGTAAVEAPDAFAFGLEKKGTAIHFLDRIPEGPNARLAFRDPAAAVGVLSGSRPAVVALGAGEVAIRGLVPLVQGLFAVLDRMGDYLAVRTDKGGSK